jgi:hypothetical protein
MSDRRHNEKEEEKREKEDEKRTEKQSDEKWRRDPVRLVFLALVLIWGGVVALVEVLGGTQPSWWNSWFVFLAGTGVLMLIKAAVRLIPEYRRPAGGTIIIGIVLLGIGIGGLVGWTYIWPAILIIVGIILIARVFFRRR